MSEASIIEVDVNFAITHWSEGAADMYGWTDKEAIGRPIWILVPRHRQAFVQGLWTRVRRGESVGPYAGLHVRKDGSRFGVEIRLEMIAAPDGTAAGARGLVRPVLVTETPEPLAEDA